MSNISVVLADYTNPEHQSAIKFMLNEYAKDNMGNGKPMDINILEKVVQDLKLFPNSFSILAYDEAKKVCGLANCFVGYSTFKAKPLVNIHDICVHSDYRNKGIGRLLIEEVERRTKEYNCCKVTLEVRLDNDAKRLYERAGFEVGEHPMLFMTREIKL